jgi:hypothetical protein
VTEWVLFGAGTPGAPDEADGPIALSTEFNINTGGSFWVTGVEFYQAANPQPGGSSYEVAIWQRVNDATPGTKIASRTVLCSSVAAGGGRRRILFTAPVAVSNAQTTGYYATLGTPQRYTATAGYFTAAGETNGPVTATQDGVGLGRNGRFKVGVSTADYPNGEFNGGGYWVTPIVSDVDPGGTPVTVTDTPGSAAAGGSPASVLIEQVVTDRPGPAAAGGSGAAVTADVVVSDASGGAAAGGSPAFALEGDVTVLDRPGGATAGGSGATVSTSSTQADNSVWPLLAGALACLQAEMAQVELPPKYVSIRPGIAFSAGMSQVEDECCEGSAWVRVVSISPTDNFPTPRTEASNCAPVALAVALELGALRCRPTSSDADQSMIVTTAQWAETTRLVMNDAAALRRAACCIAALVGNSTIGVWSPEAVEANCVGGTMQMTIQAPNCDMTC